MEFAYRVHQFWHTLTAAPSGEDLNQVRDILAPPLYDLFERMQPADQAHCLKIYHRLIKSGEKNQELLAAALLHDVGKSVYAMRTWERVLVVLVTAFLPRKAAAWGRQAGRGWKRPFAVAVHHPDWGAEMVEKAGGHPLTVCLIRCHQETVGEGCPDEDLSSREDQLLARLQRLDNES